MGIDELEVSDDLTELLTYTQEPEQKKKLSNSKSWSRYGHSLQNLSFPKISTKNKNRSLTEIASSFIESGLSKSRWIGNKILPKSVLSVKSKPKAVKKKIKGAQCRKHAKRLSYN